MAKLLVDADFLAEMLFRWSKNPVKITAARWHEDWNVVTLEIEGQDLPHGASEVTSVVRVQTNRAGEKFHTMEFREA
jgi:hypothetical protein